MAVQSVELLGGPLDGEIFEGEEARKFLLAFSDKIVCQISGHWYAFSESRNGRAYLVYAKAPEWSKGR